MNKMDNFKRTVDNDIYSKENRYDDPKESFKQIAAILNLRNAAKGKKLIDIGCATGEFLYYLKTINNDLDLTGLEHSKDLIEVAKPFLETHKIKIQQGDANCLYACPNNSFDFVTTIGVTSVFDDFRPSFSEMIRIAANKAICLNHMLVNEMDIDVIIKYINPANGKLESGWNKFSIKSISEYLNSQPSVTRFEFIKHEMPFDIMQREDKMRSWTEYKDGKRILWNGLDMEISLYHILFEIEK